ncbi:unnamed protein product [Amoebophrya sp. A120]|nr:unnamed protein product [Amoebophrya sp. A120]|eukprot:GSA120T00002453001.1
MLRHLRAFDLYPRLKQDATGDGTRGPKSSRVAFLVLFGSQLLVLLCMVTEIRDFLSPTVSQEFVVDHAEQVDVDSSSKRASPRPQLNMRVSFNLTIVDIRCLDVSLDYQNTMGLRAVDVKSGIRKVRLDGLTLRPLANLPSLPNDVEEELLDPDFPGIHHRHAGTNETCGDCYGALPATECCDTCEDVLHAYRMKKWALPRIEQLAQCRGRETESWRKVYSPSVQVARPVRPDSPPGMSRDESGDSSTRARASSISARLRESSSYPSILGSSFSIRHFRPLDLTSLSIWDFGNRDSLWEASAGKPWPNCIMKNTAIFDNEEESGGPLRGRSTEAGTTGTTDNKNSKAAGPLRVDLTVLDEFIAAETKKLEDSGRVPTARFGSLSLNPFISSTTTTSSTPAGGDTQRASALRGCAPTSSESSSATNRILGNTKGTSQSDAASAADHGAACKSTNQFESRWEEVCALVCARVPECKYWRHGFASSAMTSKCWLHASKQNNQWRLGFRSAPRDCLPPAPGDGKMNDGTLKTSSSRDGPQDHETAAHKAGHLPDEKSGASREAENNPHQDQGAAAPSSTLQTAQERRDLRTKVVKAESTGSSSPSVDPNSNVPADAAAPAAQAKNSAQTSTTRDDPAPQGENEKSAPRRRLLRIFDSDEDAFYGPGGIPLGGAQYDVLDHVRTSAQKGESCRIYGHFLTAKVPGNFHVNFKSTSSAFFQGTFDRPQKEYAHVIHHLQFTEIDPRSGEPILRRISDPQPRSERYLLSESTYLEGKKTGRTEKTSTSGNEAVHSAAGRAEVTSKGIDADKHSVRTRIRQLLQDADDGDTALDRWSPLDGTALVNTDGATTSQYYLTLIPNTDEFQQRGFQYHSAGFQTAGLFDSGIYFRYEVDPIRVLYTRKQLSPAKFLIHLCGIVGGIVATVQFMFFSTKLRT